MVIDIILKSLYNKRFQIATIVILISFNTYAQNNDLNYGLRGGVDFFNYPIEETNNSLEIDYDIGFFIGIYSKINIKDKLTLQPELVFRRHNAIQKIDDLTLETPSGIIWMNTYPTEVKVSDIIIQLPIKIHYELISNFEIAIGPQLMYIVDRDFETTKNTIEYDSETSENSEIISDIEYDKFDFGLSFGLNYRLNSSLGVFANYTAGLIERDNKINTSIIDIGIDIRVK
jgi:hypothetical protein